MILLIEGCEGLCEDDWYGFYLRLESLLSVYGLKGSIVNEKDDG